MSAAGERHSWRWFILAGLVLLALSAAWILLPMDAWIGAGVRAIDGLGAWGPIVYLLVFVTLGTVSVPTTPLYLGAGIVFGIWTGAAVALVAGFLASMISFLIARHVAHDAWEKRLQSLPRFQSLLAALEDQGFKLVVLARLSPFIPASFKNYGFGLTEIEFRRYASATALGQTPIAMTYVYLGWVGGAAMLHAERPAFTGIEITLLVAGCVASVALLGLTAWHARKLLRT